MPISVVATAGDANANSFATVERVEEILSERLYAAAWLDLEDEEVQKRAAITATRELSLYSWEGVRSTEAQALPFPRKWLPKRDPGANTVDGYFPDDEIPAWLEEATAEMALALIAAGEDLDAPKLEGSLKRRKVDVIEREWFEPRDSVSGIARAPRVAQIIAPYLAASGGIVRT